MDDEIDAVSVPKQIFDTEKGKASIRQREHLVKARAAAKATMDARRELARREEERMIKEAQTPAEEEPQTPIAYDPPAAKQPPPVAEDEDVAFERWMKNFNKAQQRALKVQKEREESQKVIVKYSQEEYDHLISLVEADKERQRAIEEEANRPKTPPPQPRRKTFRARDY